MFNNLEEIRLLLQSTPNCEEVQGMQTGAGESARESGLNAQSIPSFRTLSLLMKNEFTYKF